MEGINKKKSALFHLICIILGIIIFIYDRIKGISSFAWSWLFLTYISFYINVIYFFISYCIDIDLITNLTYKALEKYFNLCFTLSCQVTIMFWGMYICDKRTILKEGIEIPWITNISMHGGVFILCILEQMIINKRRNPDYLSVGTYFWLFCGYCLLLKVSYLLFGIVIYPFVKANFFYFAIVSGCGFLICLIGHYCYICLSKDSEINDRTEIEQHEPDIDNEK